MHASIGLFETLAQAQESTRVAEGWVREEKLERALPNRPTITSGEVIAHKKHGVTIALVPRSSVEEKAPVARGPSLWF